MTTHDNVPSWITSCKVCPRHPISGKPASAIPLTTKWILSLPSSHNCNIWRIILHIASPLWEPSRMDEQAKQQLLSNLWLSQCPVRLINEQELRSVLQISVVELMCDTQVICFIMASFTSFGITVLVKYFQLGIVYLGSSSLNKLTKPASSTILNGWQSNATISPIFLWTACALQSFEIPLLIWFFQSKLPITWSGVCVTKLFKIHDWTKIKLIIEPSIEWVNNVLPISQYQYSVHVATSLGVLLKMLF